MGRGVGCSIHSATTVALARPAKLEKFLRLGHHVRA